MPHDLTLISTIAAGLGLALICGFIAVRLKLPALVGYLAAGIIIGPYSPGYVADIALANQLAEIGVMLLMFGVGLHFSIEDLMSVKRIALPGAIVQIATATVLGMIVSSTWGWTFGEGIVFGLTLSCASTVVLIRALESRGILETVNGKIAVGWLIVEDLVLVLVLVLLPPLSVLIGGTPDPAQTESSNLWVTIGITMAKVAAFIAFMLIIGKRLFPWLLWQGAKTGSREIFTLCVIVAGVGVAYASGLLFGVSYALGAFFAGMVLRGSELSHRAAEESLPLRDAFSVLFFVAVGMLFDPSVIINEPLKMLAVLGIIIFGKSIAAFLIVILFRYPIKTALVVSASLAQIGEFSFILAGLGMTLGLLPEEGNSLILGGAIISIAFNPIVFSGVQPMLKFFKSHSSLTHLLEQRVDPLAALPTSVESAYVTGHVVLVGYGRVGRRIFESLSAQGLRIVVVEQNREAVEKLRADGHKAVAGDASDPVVLLQGHVSRASMLIVAIPDTFHIRKMLETSRRLNPKIASIVRTHSEDDIAWLKQEHVERVFLGEEELAKSMIEYVNEHLKKTAVVVA
ncbi:MAG TPA: YbaL family putative K(+) efflux transporter [Candidatus Kapabacteria bacterium]|nr:YbaL family putative K(+) efflux transporter [Candidatus Kapabacteria bacterium]